MDHTTEQRIIQALQPFEGVRLIVVFGSVASGQQRPGSDLDVGVLSVQPLSSDQKMAMNNALALAFNRPIDLVDLRNAGQPLLSEIIAGGRPLHDVEDEWGNLIYRNIMENEDFVPLQQRILREKRQAWLNS
jgi:predicted nucleotidyltransferase